MNEEVKIEEGQTEESGPLFDNEEIDILCQFIDIAVKTMGIQVAQPALFLTQKLQKLKEKQVAK